MVLSMDILWKEEWRSLKCSAHCLQLCVNAGLTCVSAVECTIASAKKLLSHYRQCCGFRGTERKTAVNGNRSEEIDSVLYKMEFVL